MREALTQDNIYLQLKLHDFVTPIRLRGNVWPVDALRRAYRSHVKPRKEGPLGAEPKDALSKAAYRDSFGEQALFER